MQATKLLQCQCNCKQRSSTIGKKLPTTSNKKKAESITKHFVLDPHTALPIEVYYIFLSVVLGEYKEWSEFPSAVINHPLPINKVNLGAQNRTQTFFSQTFRALPGYPSKIPGYPAKKVRFPGFRGTYRTFWPPPFHVEDPHPTGKYPDSKVCQGRANHEVHIVN